MDYEINVWWQRSKNAQVNSGKLWLVTCQLVCASWTHASPRPSVRASAPPLLSRWRWVRTASRRCTARRSVRPCQPPPTLKRTDNRCYGCGNWPPVCSRTTYVGRFALWQNAGRRAVRPAHKFYHTVWPYRVRNLHNRLSACLCSCTVHDFTARQTRPVGDLEIEQHLVSNLRIYFR